MKKTIAYIFAWILYYIGHGISIPMEKLKMSFLWKPYTHLMRVSYKVQIWGGAEQPWKEI
jgi:hypothetical protein